MPQNIKINNVRSLDAKVLLDEYYDFMLYKGESYGVDVNEECLAADFSSFDIDESGKIHSLTSWTGATNNGVVLNDIGLTGIDNGFITYRKDRISNQDFLNILTGATYEIDSADTRFFLSPVSGNTLEYRYPMSAVTDDEGKVQYLSFNGGFYQGFYKLYGFDYQVLPTVLNYGWTLNFKLRPRCDFETYQDTLNGVHPENEGMFFYMGTRAENKFWEFYPNNEEAKKEFHKKNADGDGYLANDCQDCGGGEIYEIYHNSVLNADYLQDEEEEMPEPYFLDGYAAGIMTPDCPCIDDLMKKDCKSFPVDYFADEYYFGGSGVVKNPEYSCIKRPVNYKDCTKQVKCGCKCTGSDVKNKLGNTYVGWFMGAYDYNPDKPCNTCGMDNRTFKSCCATEGNDYAEICKCCEDYFVDEYFGECPNSPKAFELDYLMEDVKINENGDGITDSIGHLFNRTGYFEITTDNKFLFFNQTKTGFTTCNWTEGALVTFTGRTNYMSENLFLLMNATSTGWTTSTIEKYRETREKPYDIYKDIKNNAFGLRITKDGAIGYRYGILDCAASASNHYSMVEEYSKPGIVKCNEWSDITVKIAVLNPTYSRIQMLLGSGVTICENAGITGSHKIKIYVYVNGYLKLVSKELPEFAFRELNEDYQKQEGVPFNISLGGGTQGLMETIGPDYMNDSRYLLPLERDFGGSFNGDIKSFKMYDCPFNYSTIRDYLSKNN